MGFHLEMFNAYKLRILFTDLEPDPFDSFGNIPNLIEESEAQTRGEISQKGNDVEYECY